MSLKTVSSSKCRKTITVAADGSGDFCTLSAAIQAAQCHPAEPVLFLVGRGDYPERPFVELDDYIIRGEGADCVRFHADIGGRDPWPCEEKTGTFRSWVLFLGGKCAELSGLTVENTAGDGSQRGQAVALYADAAEIFVHDCVLLGNQDTLFTSPLPLKVREKNGFRGPRENAPRTHTKQFYRRCQISGNIDFIFGGADAVFFDCEIQPRAHSGSVSYITAASTPQGEPGYLFANCRVHGDAPAHSVYLGRPWRSFARVFWLDCELSDEIHLDGWDNWGTPENETTAQFGEACNRGPGAAKHRAFGTVNCADEIGVQRARLADCLAAHENA